MHNRYSDFEELRPIGEASHIPDEQLSDGYDSEPKYQRGATRTGNYPDEPTDTGRECQSCGTSIPAGQTKCRFCLNNHIGDDPASTDETADVTFLGIVHMVVKSTTFHGAVAKGGAAANLLTANEAEPAVDDYTLIYDLDEMPARQLADQWPSLPDAVQADSTAGEQLLTAACDRTGCGAHEALEHQQPPTRLYDQCGNAIRDESCLSEILDDTDEKAWLVPAIGLTKTAGEEKSDSQRSTVPTTDHLDCQKCGRTTDHQFKTYESIPDETWTGQPIWECKVCKTVRHGPVPKSHREELTGS
ncbi:hypothetical protein ACFQDG_00160 [Natronoarchaeum mannanilyticum]|uniref:Uncharacterized protein n=1 Tax=Natronoarchaeum mannanilyticum TaxID=926360 RepID=A0AAV3TEK7_9EURY